MRITRHVLMTVLLLGVVSSTLAQETTPSPDTSTPAEKKQYAFEVHGFLVGAFSGRTTGQQPPRSDGGDIVLGEERVHLDIDGGTRSGAVLFRAKGDAFHDAIANHIDIDLREAYAGYTKGPLDVRLGRQIFTWGVGDLFFINDVFPKDWNSYFSGRSMEYLKRGVDGLWIRYTSEVITVECLTLPSFTSDALPSAARFFFFDPFSGVPNQQETEPASRFSNIEAAFRLSRQVRGFDASLYAYRGFWRTPSIRLDNPVSPATVTRFYPPLSVYGFSAQRNLFDGVVSLEAGYYDSRQDRSGHDPMVPNAQGRFLAGYQRQPWSECTVGLQVYGEQIVHYRAYRNTLPPDSPRQDRFRGVVSIRLTQWLAYQTWTLSLFAAQSPTDQDYFVQPEIAHRVRDNLRVSLGANLFGGRHETTFFGQFEKSDDVFVSIRFDF